MKKIKLLSVNTILVLFSIFMTSCSVAKDGEPTRRVAYIQTNAICGDCKERIEGVLNYEKGISYAIFHLDTKKVEVKYNSKKTSLETIRKTISDIGYQADDIAPNLAAREKLPTCCKIDIGH